MNGHIHLSAHGNGAMVHGAMEWNLFMPWHEDRRVIEADADAIDSASS